MKSSLTKKDRVIIMIGSLILTGFMVMAAIGVETVKPEGGVQRIFREATDVLGFIVKNFTFPVVTFIILVYALKLSRKSRENKWGFYIGLALCIWAISIHRLGLIPASTTPSAILGWKILIYSITSALIGFGFLYLLDVVANRPISGLLIALMTGTSLTCFYFYYFYESLQSYLLPIAPAVFFGGGFYEMIRKKEVRVEEVKEGKGQNEKL